MRIATGMARYTDELDPVLDSERRLRRLIALAIGEERGQRPAEPTPDLVEAAEAAIAAWDEDAAEQLDLAAFRPLTPLQKLLVEHEEIVARIADIRDSCLS